MKQRTYLILGLWLTALLVSQAQASYHYDQQSIKQMLIHEANYQGIEPALALAIARVESNFDPMALSHAGAKGVMQIMPRTAELGFAVSRARLFDPQTNIRVGIKFIKQLLKKYEGRLDIALSHYNGGSKVKSKSGQLTVIPATENYVKKVLAYRQEFLSLAKRPQRSITQPFQGDNLLVCAPNWPSDTCIVESEQEQPLPATDNPQVTRLRALRMHNITRNYKHKNSGFMLAKSTTQARHNLPSNADTPLSMDLRLKKVRLWESIYAH
jgi:hypothetical protein